MNYYEIATKHDIAIFDGITDYNVHVLKDITKNDLKIKLSEDNLTANIIIDSRLMEENISNTDRDRDWFIQQLKIKGYDTYEAILLATYKDNKITIYRKDYREPKDVLE